jgi:hypothetical protein
MWEITRDWIGYFKDDKYIESHGEPPHKPVQSRDFDDAKAKTVPHYPFKMYDADGNLYYEGWSDDCTSEKAFGPLDDFGMPNAGAIDIKYLDPMNHTWRSL